MKRLTHPDRLFPAFHLTLVCLCAIAVIFGFFGVALILALFGLAGTIAYLIYLIRFQPSERGPSDNERTHPN